MWLTVQAGVFSVSWPLQDNMTSSEWHREDVRGHKLACLAVESVECDVTLIRVQAARGGGRKTSLRVTSPAAALVPKSMLSLRPRPNFRRWKKFERILRKRPGWSPPLKLKYHLGKQTGFPPAAAHPSSHLSPFSACHFSPLCFWSASYVSTASCHLLYKSCSQH